MTLKEKVYSVFYETANLDLATKLIEKIADEHAIKFAEWIKNSSIKNTDLPINVLLKMYKDKKVL